MSDTEQFLSDTTIQVSRDNTDTSAHFIKASISDDRAAIPDPKKASKRKDNGTCESRKADAVAERAQLRRDGIAENAPSLRKLNRQITFLNGRCPGFRTTAQLRTSLCERRKVALKSKLLGFKNAGMLETDQAFIRAEQELAATSRQCSGHR
ncbi:MAG: hypothetical protein AB3N28_03010 [Kordiimonas sp.]